MNGWFTIEKIDAQTFAISEYRHWEETHCYLLCGHGLFDRIAVHEAEKDWIDGGFPLPLNEVKEQLTKPPCTLPEEFDLDLYRIFQGKPQILFHDGDCFDLGGRTIRVLHTPGHSPGHCCFYEQERRYLYSGDLVYKGCLDRNVRIMV